MGTPSILLVLLVLQVVGTILSPPHVCSITLTTICLCHTYYFNDKHCAANINRHCLHICSPRKSKGVLVICCCVVTQAVCYFVYSGCMGQCACTFILHVVCQFCMLHSQLLAPEKKMQCRNVTSLICLGTDTAHPAATETAR